MKKFLIVIGVLLLIYFAYITYRDNIDTSDHHINSLYNSEERIYNNYLTQDEQDMYNLLLDKTIKHKNKFNILIEDFNCDDQLVCSGLLKNVHEAITVDHPELMNYGGYTWRYKDNTFTISLQFAYNLDFKDYYGEYIINKKLDKIEEETKNMTDKEKILYVYNWMGENNVYDHYFTYTSKNQSIYNVFVKKNAVCTGFAKASQIIFQRIGIKSEIVSGYTDDYHMWNIIEYDGKYYFFDSTVAVGYKKSSENYYDGIRQNKMGNYSITYGKWYPDIEQTELFEV